MHELTVLHQLLCMHVYFISVYIYYVIKLHCLLTHNEHLVSLN